MLCKAISTAAIATVYIALSISSVLAQSSGSLNVKTPMGSGGGAYSSSGPTVGQNFRADVDVGNVRATARDDSKASNRIGAMTSGGVGGTFDSRVRAKDITAEATSRSCAENVIGAMGTAACQEQ